MTARNDITGDKIQSKISNANFENNFDAIFRKDKKTTVGYPPLTTNKPLESTDEWDEKRIDIIGSNGPTGEHYKEQK
jgi:hypothetical protein